MAQASDKFTGTMPVREAHRMDEARLHAWLEANVEGYAGPLEVQQFKGGQSNPTYLLSTPGQRYVLRRKPPGKLLPSAHAVDREYRVMTALAETPVPVPRTYGLCEDPEVVGTPFFVMEFCQGRIFWDGKLPGMEPAERTAIYGAMNQVIADLHQVDFEAVGLGDYGRRSGYVERQIKRWSKQYRASEIDTIEAMDRLIEWLPQHIPEGDAVSIVHGDYRLDNMVFHPTEARVIGVLDWELSTLGHPLADLAYHCMTWRFPKMGAFTGLLGVDFAALGIPDEAAYRAMYAERTGRGADISDAEWRFFMAYNMFRAAAIFQGIAKRVKDGTAASKHGAMMGALARPVADLGWKEVQAIAA